MQFLTGVVWKLPQHLVKEEAGCKFPTRAVRKAVAQPRLEQAGHDSQLFLVWSRWDVIPDWGVTETGL